MNPFSPGFVALVDDAKTRVRHIDAAELKRMLEAGEPIVLIDVREESEWEAGHAEGAIHLCKYTIERDIESRVPDHSAAILLYCGRGYLSALAADNLRKMGYEKVMSLDGGWRAYIRAGLPIE
jgi:rhodanese-related sulfurtransferase